MSDFQSDFEEFDNVEYTDINLSIVDTTGAKFRTDDDRPPPNTIVKETGVHVSYGIVDKIHGKLPISDKNVDEDKTFCSIFVIDFKFDIFRHSACIHHAYIDVVVSDPGREIRFVTPADRVSLNKQSKAIENTVGAGANAGHGVFGANANAQIKSKRDKVAYATVSGWPSHHPNNRTGPPNCGKWAVHENEVAKDGVPARLRVAILVLREDEKEFQLDVIFNIKADWLSRLEDMFGETPPHLPNEINPRDTSTKRVIKKYNEEDMSEAVRDLGKVFKVSYGSQRDRFSDD